MAGGAYYFAGPAVPALGTVFEEEPISKLYGSFPYEKLYIIININIENNSKRPSNPS